MVQKTDWVTEPHRLAALGAVHGPAGPISLKTVHWTVFRALDAPFRGGNPTDLACGLRGLRYSNYDMARYFEGVCGTIDRTVNEILGK